jgi:hypothetical protein
MQIERKLHAKRFLNDGFSGAGPDMATEDLPPAKRQRREPVRSSEEAQTAQLIDSDDSACGEVEVQDQHGREFERYRKPKRRWLWLRRAAKKRTEARRTLGKNRSTESVISEGPSVAPSSAEPLPGKMIPKRKHAAVQRWRDMVATGEDTAGDSDSSSAMVQRGKWVDALECDTSTGGETGDLERIADHTCSSCGPSSPTLSACSLSSEELARWNRKEPEDFRHLQLDQWF